MELLRPATRQRLLGFGLGSAAALIAYTAFQRKVSHDAAQVAQLYGAPAPTVGTDEDGGPALTGAKVWASFTRKWNQGVDATVGVAAAELARWGL
jgi:hypothetical protein